MDTRELLINLGEAIGHQVLLKACKESTTKDSYIVKLVSANTLPIKDECRGHDGECGECRTGVWYPCI